MHSIIANKCTDSIRTMLPSTARNITCDTDIKGAITLAGEDVDARTLLTHSAAPWSSQGQALGPRFRGDDENLSSPSERGYRSEMGTTYANLRNQGLDEYRNHGCKPHWGVPVK